MTEEFKRIETKIIHAGDPRPRINGALEATEDLIEDFDRALND